MDSSDGLTYQEIWNRPSLHDNLFPSYSSDHLWNFNTASNPNNLPPPLAQFPFNHRLHMSQQQRSNNANSLADTGSTLSGRFPTPAIGRKRSHLDLPNFPLATDPTEVPSNSSGRPPHTTLNRIPPPNTRSHPSGHTPNRPAPPPSLRESLSPPDTFTGSSSSEDSSSIEPETEQDPASASDSDSDSEIDSDSTSESGSTSTFHSTFESTQENPNDFIDLTRDSSPPAMARTARATLRPAQYRSSTRPPPNTRRSSSEAPSNPAKRRKRGAEASQSSQRSKTIEEVDLRDVDDDEALSKVLEQQRMATIKAQQAQAETPLTLSSLQCIICMESMTNMTATSCGHLFCGSCLHSALVVGESPKCPVCRKKVSASTGRGKGYSVIPLALKVMTKRKTSGSKGKGRAIN